MSKPRKAPVGSRNIVGAKVVWLRRERGIKQKDLVAKLQSLGMDIGDTTCPAWRGKLDWYKILKW